MSLDNHLDLSLAMMLGYEPAGRLGGTGDNVVICQSTSHLIKRGLLGSSICTNDSGVNGYIGRDTSVRAASHGSSFYLPYETFAARWARCI